MTRRIRPPRTAVVVTSTLATVLLAGCGAGFDAQTGLVQGGIGAHAEVGGVNVLNVLLVAPAEEGGGSGEGGETGQAAAALVAGIVNENQEPDRLVDIALADGEGSLTSTLPPEGIELPTDRLVSFHAEDGPEVTLYGPKEEFTLGTTVRLRMSFERAGEVTVPAVVYAAEGDYAEVTPQPEPTEDDASPTAAPTGSPTATPGG